jgi:hypothetical protein
MMINTLLKTSISATFPGATVSPVKSKTIGVLLSYGVHYWESWVFCWEADEAIADAHRGSAKVKARSIVFEPLTDSIPRAIACNILEGDKY